MYTYTYIYIYIHDIAIHCITLHCVALHYITLQYIAIPYIHTQTIYIHIYVYIYIHIQTYIYNITLYIIVIYNVYQQSGEIRAKLNPVATIPAWWVPWGAFSSLASVARALAAKKLSICSASDVLAVGRWALDTTRGTSPYDSWLTHESQKECLWQVCLFLTCRLVKLRAGTFRKLKTTSTCSSSSLLEGVFIIDFLGQHTHIRQSMWD